VVHRSDGSGTTLHLHRFLNKFSREWRDKVGFATSVNWPVGLGGRATRASPSRSSRWSAIGYVELIYALSNDLAFAHIKNSAGEFVTPSLERVTPPRPAERSSSRY
jgi:phosphate transport system substrate-binding protein